MDLTSGRWPRWVARYEKGGWAVHFRSDIRKVRGGGGGGGGHSRQVHYEKLRKVFFFLGGGGGGGNSRQVQKLRKPGPAPHKRTLTLLGGGGGGFVRTPPGYGLVVFGPMCIS